MLPTAISDFLLEKYLVNRFRKIIAYTNNEFSFNHSLFQLDGAKIPNQGISCVIYSQPLKATIVFTDFITIDNLSLITY